MPNIRGIFSLKEAFKFKFSNQWVPLDEVWIVPSPSSPNTGYFGGGVPATSIMDKVTYSTDTTAAVPGANLSLARLALAATGNGTNGYFGGGNPGPKSTMDKVTYSTDTTAAVPGADLSLARFGVAQQVIVPMVTLVVVVLVGYQQWIRSLIPLIPQQQFLMPI